MEDSKKMVIKVYFCLDGATWERQDNVDDDIQFVEYPITVKDTLDETLDEGSFAFSNHDRSMFPRNMPVKVEFAESEESEAAFKRYFIANDTVRQRNYCKPLWYTHDFQLCEPTKLLERRFVFGKAFTQPIDKSEVKYYMDDVVDITLRVIEPLKSKEKCTFHLDEAIRAKLHACTPMEFYWSNRMSLWECLNDVGRSIGAIPRLISLNDSPVYNTVTFDFYNEDGEEIVGGKIPFNDYRASCNTEYYCSDLVTIAENVVPSSPIWFPSADSWVTCRTDGVRLEDENAYIPTGMPSYKIEKVFVDVAEVHVNHYIVKSDQTHDINKHADHRVGDFLSNTEIDITEFVLEKSLYDLLPTAGIDSNINKGNHLYYSQGNDKIENILGLAKWILLQERYAMSIILLKCLRGKEIVINENDRVHPKIYDIRDDKTNFMALPYRIQFAPMPQSMVVMASKGNLNFDNQMAHNPQSETASLDKLTKVMNNTIKRLGNYEVQVCADYYDTASLPLVGQTFQLDGKKYHITNCTYANINTTTLRVLIDASENFIRTCEEIALDRKYRQYPIPTETLSRSVVINKVIRLSQTKQTNNSGIAKNMLERFCFAMFLEGPQALINGKIQLALHNGIKWVTLPTLSNTLSNGIQFDLTFPTNNVVGRRLSGNRVEDVMYCDSNGELEICKVFADVKDCIQYNANSYPEITLNSNSAVIFNNVYVKKDAAEKLSLTVRICIEGDENIFINDDLTNIGASSGREVRKLTQPLTLYTKNVLAISEPTEADCEYDLENYKYVFSKLPSDGVGYVYCRKNGTLIFGENVDLSTLEGNKREIWQIV